MPALDDSLENSGQSRVLIYGRPMTRKTWWALRAAELGFNVLYFDFDSNFQVAQNLSPEARGRIYRVDCRMPTGLLMNNMALTLLKISKGERVLIDEETRRFTQKGQVVAEKNYLAVQLDKASETDVVVIDSWTAFTLCLAQHQRNMNDPELVTKLEWDDYAKLRMAEDMLLDNMRRLSSHLIVVGHAETNAKRKPDADPKGRPHEVIETVREQVASASRAHGEMIAGKFTDQLFFTIPAGTKAPNISTAGNADFDAGARRVPPARYMWDDLTIDRLMSPGVVAAAKNSIPSGAWQTVTGQSVIDERGKAGSAVIDTPAKPTILNIGKK